MIKTLIVRMNNNANFSVTGSEEKISSLIKWANSYRHGTYNGSDTFICNTHNDFMICRLKAIRLGLVPCASTDEIKSKSVSTLM